MTEHLPRAGWKRALLLVLAAAMVWVGAQHFLNPAPFVRIVPDYLPAPLALVYISGFFEVLGGLGPLLPATRRYAAWGLIALFVAVFPANIHMTLNEIQLEPGGTIPVWAMWARLPLQGVLIAWAWLFTKPRPRWPLASRHADLNDSAVLDVSRDTPAGSKSCSAEGRRCRTSPHVD